MVKKKNLTPYNTKNAESITKWTRANPKNAKSFTKWNRANHKNAESIAKWIEQILKMRRNKNYKNMSKKELIITLLKLGCSLAEFYKSKSDNAKIEETKKSFNELRDFKNQK